MIGRPRLTLLIAAILAACSLLFISRLRVDTSLASLFDQDRPAVQALTRVMENFRSVEELLILAETPESAPPTPDTLIAFAGRLEQAIHADSGASSLADGVIYGADEQTRTFFERVLVPNGLFYLDDAAFDAARKRLTPEEIATQIRRNETMISTPGPAADALAKVILKDPLRLHEFVLDRISAARPVKTYQNSDAFLSPDGRALLIRVRGKRPISDLEFSREFTAVIERLAEHANTDRLRLSFSGGYAIAAASERAIRADMIANVISAVVCLQLLFVLAYRRPIRSFLLAFMPVAVGLLYGFGAYAMLARGLTPMTAVIGGILAGMAIDYAIAFLSFYGVRRAAGETGENAARTTRRMVGTALLAAWATSIVGFIAVCWSQVKALRDFALLGSLGLTGAFLCSLFVLPALLVLVDRSERNTQSLGGRLLIAPMLEALHRQPGWAIGFMLTILLATGVTLALPGPFLPLESDLTVMHPRPNPPLDAQTRIGERMGMSPGTLVVHLSAPNDSDLLKLAHNADRQLRSDAAKQAGVVGTFGLASLLPDPSFASRRVNATGTAMADRVIGDFNAAIAQSLFDAKAYEPYVGFLWQLLTRTRPPDITDLIAYKSLADNILPASAFAAGAAPPTEAITLIFLRDPGERRESRDLAVGGIRNALADLPGATLTGLSVLNHDTEQTIRQDLPRLLVISIAIVTLYLMVHFRNLADCLLAMLPTIIGLICLLAFMRWTGQKLNMINLIAFPLLIGIDVDYGIFLVSAGRRRDLRGLSGGKIIERLTPALSAVVLCAATTTLGFGSLAFTSVPAVRSLGVAVAVGVLSCLASTILLVVPILFLLRCRDREIETGT